MNRMALMTGILSLTLVSVAAFAQQTPTAPTQSGSQPKYYQTQPQAQTQTQPTVPGSTYEATQQRSMTQSGSQPKLHQQQNQPPALSSEPAPASGMGAVGTATGLTSPPPAVSATQQPSPYPSAPPTASQPSAMGQPGASQPGFAAAPTTSMGTGDVTTGVQQELMQAGYDPGPIDGIHGPRTAKAIKQYQADNGLAQDGQASPTLLDHMRLKRQQAAAGSTAQPQFQSPQTQLPPSQAQLPSESTAQSTAGSSMAGVSPSSGESQKSTGFFSGWFQRMDDEPSRGTAETQSGYQPKFYRENTASQESQGPGITNPYPERPVASAPSQPPSQPMTAPPPASPPPQQLSSGSAPSLPGQSSQPTADDAAAASRISPAAGSPATAPVGSPPPQNGDTSGSRLMSEIEKCQQMSDLAARSDCEMQAHKKVSESSEARPLALQPDDTFDRNNNGGDQ